MKKAIVIGATSGIGRETAVRLVDEGWEVGVSGRRIEALEAFREEYGERVHIKQMNVTQEDATAGIDEALEIITYEFRGQKDIDGNPAILHPLTVGLMGANDNEKTVGFLHDLIEDCDWSIEDLQTEGFLDEVVEAVDILTHRKDEDSYDEYVNKIILSGNRLAINVKLNDLHHNLQRGKVSYEAAVASNDAAKIKELERINAKHEKALEMIKNAGYEQ